MSSQIYEILSSKSKHKEQVELITRLAIKDKKVLAEVVDILETGTDVDKGTAAEVMKFVSKQKPEMLLPYINLLIKYIDYKAPRVRWGCPESIGHIASKYPQHVEKAIPKLLGNLEDKSTVVRWCAAYALTEIVKNHKGKQKELVGTIQKLIKIESNNGVRNVIIKAMKEVENRQPL